MVTHVWRVQLTGTVRVCRKQTNKTRFTRSHVRRRWRRSCGRACGRTPAGRRMCETYAHQIDYHIYYTKRALGECSSTLAECVAVHICRARAASVRNIPNTTGVAEWNRVGDRARGSLPTGHGSCSMSSSATSTTTMSQ